MKAPLVFTFMFPLIAAFAIPVDSHGISWEANPTVWWSEDVQTEAVQEQNAEVSLVSKKDKDSKKDKEKKKKKKKNSKKTADNRSKYSKKTTKKSSKVS